MQQTVALCDSRRLFGDALSALMSRESDLAFVGQATDAAEAVRLVDERHPDLLLVDGGLREMPSADFVRELLARTPRLSIVLLVDDAMFSAVESNLAAGAKGIVLKQQPWTTVAEALRQALRGQSYVAPELASRAAGQSGPPSTADGLGHRQSTRGLDRLTARERQIFDLIVGGYKNQEIATLLGVSIKTVETHRASINRKLSVHSTGQMIRFAATQGLIPQVADLGPRKAEISIAPASATIPIEAPTAAAVVAR